LTVRPSIVTVAEEITCAVVVVVAFGCDVVVGVADPDEGVLEQAAAKRPSAGSERTKKNALRCFMRQQSLESGGKETV
jgi:hypothetical protein